MRSPFIILFLFIGVCLSVFNFSCKQNAKDKAKTQHVNKSNPQASVNIKRNSKSDSSKIIADSLAKAYNILPQIYLPFFPSSSKLNCKQLITTYTTVDNKDQAFINGQTYLTTLDTTFLILKLKNKRPLVVNPEGGTSFGTLGYRGSTDTLNGQNDIENTIDNAVTNSKIGVVWAKKVGDDYMCYIMITGKEWFIGDLGILMLITPHGDILDWMPSKGLLGIGNPHGGIERMFTVLPNNTIRINEDSFGDNSDIYEFYANYVVKNKRFVLQNRKLHMIRLQGEK